MRPFHFGDSARPLFGLYHEPGGERPRDSAVLLCGPGPQEYMSSHWAVRKLAAALARGGFHVMRFDYSGTGDSAGETGTATLADWRSDIALAVEELRDLAGVRRIAVVGYRLGAALAAQAEIKVRDLVLWEPVIFGAGYLAELRDAHRRLFEHCLYPPAAAGPGQGGELMGLAFPIAEEQATAAIDLMQPFASRADRVVIVSSDPASTIAPLAAAVRAGASRPEVVELRPPADAQVEPDAPRAADEPFLLSSRAQQAIASLLAGSAA